MGSRPNTSLLQHSASFARLAFEITLHSMYLQQLALAQRFRKKSSRILLTVSGVG